ncbi:M24 family metallopeptidase [Mycobacterium sp. 663a-19]|uniref:M24 family metallopeptidase n=1 Tax=Mycobacterium sp. 663a-19 TaxID=2986148 RepID=UPI002D1F95A0|nr:M24 family metallopeptidase [Mycobacterium sp. 663a-19]MEB3980046.1 M24 family metallopeptidase [Mycobacterium sp. 663a-19]
MLLSQTERDRRWAALTQLMDTHDLEAVLVYGTSQANGHLRYLTLFAPPIDSAAFVIFRDGTNILALPDGVMSYYASKTSWAETRTIGTGIELLDCLSRKNVQRIGIAGPEGVPHHWYNGLRERLSHDDVVNISAELTKARWIKSAEEIALVRQSCAIADEAWAQVHDIVRGGRHAHEVLADIEHSLRRRGCDGSFNLVIPLPDAEFDRLPPTHTLRSGDVFILEVSPQFGGYFSQLTSVISMGPANPAMRAGFEAGVQARAAAQSQLVPGADLARVSQAIATDLREHGHEMRSSDIGHLCGVELAEPRVGSTSLKLQAGMVLIFHPVVADQQYNFLMRADTYLIHEHGAERLTTHPTDLPECA